MFDFKLHPDYNPKKKFQVLSRQEDSPECESLVKGIPEEPTVYQIIEDDVLTMEIRREKQFGGFWVARKTGTDTYVDKDQYRSDLFERLEYKVKR